MNKIIIKYFANMLGFYIAGVIFPAITFASPANLFWAGIVLGLLNLFIRPFLLLITFPLTLMTLGMFTLVINTLLVIITAHLVNGLSIPSFSLFFATSLLICITNIIGNRLLR